MHKKSFLRNDDSSRKQSKSSIICCLVCCVFLVYILILMPLLGTTAETSLPINVEVVTEKINKFQIDV